MRLGETEAGTISEVYTLAVVSDSAEAQSDEENRHQPAEKDRKRAETRMPNRRIRLVRIESDALDRALTKWCRAWGLDDSALALCGKTMKNAVDETGRQTHVSSFIGRNSRQCHAQKSRQPPPRAHRGAAHLVHNGAERLFRLPAHRAMFFHRAYRRAQLGYRLRTHQPNPGTGRAGESPTNPSPRCCTNCASDSAPCWIVHA